MSTDDKWLETDSELIEEFNARAPYGLEHRRPGDDWQVQKVQFNFYLRNQIAKKKLEEEVKESINLLLRNPAV